MYLPEWVQKFKEPRTEIKKIKGGFYKYAVEYKYNSDKKRTDKITKHLLGKITETEGFVPSDKYSLQEKVLQIPRVDIKTFGVFKLFSSLLAEDLPSLLALFPAEISETLLTISMMRFAYQSPLKRIPYLHSHDFCAQHWVPDGLNDKRITSALRHIGENRNLILDWMKTAQFYLMGIRGINL